MNRWLVVYSSVTGNTKKVAEAFCEAVNGTLVRVEDAKEPEGFDAVAVGYWLWRGGPDPKTAAYLSRLSGVNVALFETHAADNRSEHSVTAFARTAACLGKDCRVLKRCVRNARSWKPKSRQILTRNRRAGKTPSVILTKPI